MGFLGYILAFFGGILSAAMFGVSALQNLAGSVEGTLSSIPVIGTLFSGLGGA